MLPDDPIAQGRLFYLVLLLLGVAAFFLIGHRQPWLRSLRDLALWLLILAMLVIAYGFRDTLRQALLPGSAVQMTDDAVEIRRGIDGQFRAELEVNGRPVRFVIDTGASSLVLSRRDAAAVGIDVADLRFTGRAITANGPVSTAPVVLDEVRLGDLVDRDVAARVNGGQLDQSLLGMAYLDRFVRIEIEGDRMRLRR